MMAANALSDSRRKSPEGQDYLIDVRDFIFETGYQHEHAASNIVFLKFSPPINVTEGKGPQIPVSKERQHKMRGSLAKPGALFTSCPRLMLLLWLVTAGMLVVDCVWSPFPLFGYYTLPVLVAAFVCRSNSVLLLALFALACSIASGLWDGTYATSRLAARVGSVAAINALAVTIAARRSRRLGSSEARPEESQSAGIAVASSKGNAEPANRPLTFERRKKRDFTRDATTQIEELELLTQRLIQIQEQQQQTVSRELHDNVAQVLTAVTNRITLARNSGAKLPAWLLHELHDFQESINGALTDIRILAREMRPSLLDHCGFAAALEKHTEDFRKRTGMDFALELDGDAAVTFDNEHLTHLFRLVQEALQNIEEHSGASRAWLRLARQNGEVHLEIGDNGCSFTEARIVEAQRDGHLGLLGMRERAELLGGYFILEADPPQGTTIRVAIPVPPGKTQT